MQDYSGHQRRVTQHKIRLGRDADAAVRRWAPSESRVDAPPPQNGRAPDDTWDVSEKNALPRRLSAQVHCDRGHGRRQELPVTAVHGAGLDVQRAARRDDWRRIWCAKSRGQWPGSQIADLGHGGPGIIQKHHAELLPRRRGGVARVRHQSKSHVPQLQDVADRSESVWEPADGRDPRGEQI